MNKIIGVLILHGVGIQKAGYSTSLQNGVNESLETAGYNQEQVAYREVLYSNIFDEQQKERSKYLINTSGKFQFITRAIRKLLIFVLSDAVSYRAQYKRVHARISENIITLQSALPESAPVIIVAHSMGVIAISDYIYDLQKKKYSEEKFSEINNLKSMITFGCNIPLFEMGHENPVSIKRPESDADKKEFFWLNFYSPFDVLGYRISKYYSTQPEFPINDEKVYAGGFFSKWNLLSHAAYWKNGKVNKFISDTIIKSLE